VEVTWRQHLGRCVDAAPLVLVYFGPLVTAGSSSKNHSSNGSSSTAAAAARAGLTPGAQPRPVVCVVVFACSHNGRVTCVDTASGASSLLCAVQLMPRARHVLPGQIASSWFNDCAVEKSHFWLLLLLLLLTQSSSITISKPPFAGS